jgi:hypothetical protein
MVLEVFLPVEKEGDSNLVPLSLVPFTPFCSTLDTIIAAVCPFVQHENKAPSGAFANRLKGISQLGHPASSTTTCSVYLSGSPEL